MAPKKIVLFLSLVIGNYYLNLVLGTKDIFVSKTANDSFYKSELEDILNELEINELYIAGCATDFCVDSTVKSALNKDYKVTVIEDGHTTATRPHIDVQTTIKHYNWLWADMTPTRYRIEVKKVKDLTGLI